jgi:hypothetical protein
MDSNSQNTLFNLTAQNRTSSKSKLLVVGTVALVAVAGLAAL